MIVAACLWSCVALGAAQRQCDLLDPLLRWREILASRSRWENLLRLDVFVSGIEGAGHHGAVNGFVVPIATKVAGVRHPAPKRRGKASTSGGESNEVPYYVKPESARRGCRVFSCVGWESYPSDRRLGVQDRLAALYAGHECFPRTFWPRFPPSWHAATPVEFEGCWRCGTWRATLDDVYARLLGSDRLDARALAGSVSGLKVLVLWRDFVRAAFSHRNLDGKNRGHAIMLAAHAAAMAHDAAAMPHGAWKLLHYEDLAYPETYVAAGVALARFLQLPAIPPHDDPDGLRRAVLDARNATWRAPSTQKDALLHHAGPLRDATREVYLYFSHRWTIFEKPEHHLIPTARSTQDPEAWPENATRGAPACPPPRDNPCTRCSATPITNASAVRFCQGDADLRGCCPRPTTTRR